MRTYSMKEVAKKIKVPQGTIRQWEKDLNGFLVVPRSKQGARLYTDFEIDLLIQIKQMLDDKVEFGTISAWLAGKTGFHKSEGTNLKEVQDTETEIWPVTLFETMSETMLENAGSIEPPNTLETESEKLETVTESESFPELSLTVVPENTTPSNEDPSIKNANEFFMAMDTYRENFLSDVKTEIRNVLRKEVIEEVKKEITKGTLCTVKSISDSIYKSNENTKSEIQGLAETIEKTAEHTTDSLQYLSNRITNVSIETTEEIFTLSKQLSETTEELAHYVDVTNNELYNLTETLTKEREYLDAEREQYRHEIRQREAAFQDMLASFRDVAAGKEKKWWKFWSN